MDMQTITLNASSLAGVGITEKASTIFRYVLDLLTQHVAFKVYTIQHLVTRHSQHHRTRSIKLSQKQSKYTCQHPSS